MGRSSCAAGRGLDDFHRVGGVLVGWVNGQYFLIVRSGSRLVALLQVVVAEVVVGLNQAGLVLVGVGASYLDILLIVGLS